jgi:hypothetical protein
VTFSFSPAGALTCSKGDKIGDSSKGTASCTLKLTKSVTVTAQYAGSSSYTKSTGSYKQTGG